MASGEGIGETGRESSSMCGGLIGYADDGKGCRVTMFRQNYRGVVSNFKVTKIYV
jgi:hypothetical protein